jgi:hypothetical protein
MPNNKSGEIQKLFPSIQGLDPTKDWPKIEREIFVSFLRIYDYFNSKIKVSVEEANKLSKEQSQQVAKEASTLINNFATKLIGEAEDANPLETLGEGTVTSVAATGNIVFSVGGTPITTSGTFTFILNTQTANTIFAGPTSGAAATPTFRLLTPNDLPRTSSAADPSTTEFPNSGDWGVHKNTVSGFVYLAYNNAGAILKVQLV